MEYFGTGDIIRRGPGTELQGSSLKRNFGNMENLPANDRGCHVLSIRSQIVQYPGDALVEDVW